MLNINFKLLHMFLLVAENNSFRRAAEKSNRSEAAVSMQIKHLEQQLEVALFHRTTRRVELTKDGEHLLISVRKALAEVETGLLQIRESVDMHYGVLSISCVPTVAATRLPHILLAFQKEHPKISVHVRELVTTELLESIRRREVDFGIGPKIRTITEFSFKPILSDNTYALIPSTYKLRRKSGITLEELSRLPILMLSTASAFRRELDAALKTKNLTFDTKFEVIQAQTLIAMAEAGLGAAILPKISMPLRTCLQAVPVIDPQMIRQISIITLRGQALSPAAARLASFVERLIAPAVIKVSVAPAPS